MIRESGRQDSGTRRVSGQINIIAKGALGTVSLTVWVVLFGCMGAVVLALWGTLERNRWGLNFGRVVCPRCLRTIPNPSGLRGLRQKLFGGGACAECKTIVNKWGREIMPNHGDRIKAQNRTGR